MTAAIVWLVVWFVAIWAGSALIWLVLGMGGAVVSAAIDRVWLGFVTVGLAWLCVAAWVVLCVVNVIMQVIDVVHLAGA